VSRARIQDRTPFPPRARGPRSPAWERGGSRLRGGFALAVLLLAPGARPAWAEEKATCVQSAERAQGLRAQGKLVAARRDLAICAGATCPSVVRSDCQVWLREVTALVPTLALQVLDEAGAPIADATVAIDGEARILRPGGEPIPLDPGPHWVEVVSPGRARVKEFVNLAAGDGARPLVLKLAAAPAAPAPQPPPPPVPAAAIDTTAAEPAPPSRAPVWIAGGLVATGVVAFAVLGVTGWRDADRLRSTCAPACDDGEVRSVRRRLVLADVSLGLAALSGGLWLAFGGRF
jgi:hypothetical protein